LNFRFLRRITSRVCCSQRRGFSSSLRYDDFVCVCVCVRLALCCVGREGVDQSAFRLYVTHTPFFQRTSTKPIHTTHSWTSRPQKCLRTETRPKNARCEWSRNFLN
jgi:hypothetical protein